jgi:hypothetical protein
LLRIHVVVDLIENPQSNLALGCDAPVPTLTHFQLVEIVEGGTDNEQLEPFELAESKGSFSGDFHRGLETKVSIAQKPAPVKGDWLRERDGLPPLAFGCYLVGNQAGTASPSGASAASSAGASGTVRLKASRMSL